MRTFHCQSDLRLKRLMYRLTMDAPPHNLRPRYNVCPTDPVDVVTAAEGKRELVPMRWGLVPWWWSKSLKRTPDGDLQRSRGDSREQARLPRRVQTLALPHSDVRLSRMAEHPRAKKQPWYFTGRRWLTTSDSCRPLGRVERPRRPASG